MLILNNKLSDKYEEINKKLIHVVGFFIIFITFFNCNSPTTLEGTSNDGEGDENETEQIVNNDVFEDSNDIEGNNNEEEDVDDSKSEEGSQEETYVSRSASREEDDHKPLPKPIIEDVDEDILVDDMNSIFEKIVVDEDKGRVGNIIIKIIKKRKSKTKIINEKKIKKLFRLGLTKEEDNREKRIKFDVSNIEKGACNLSLKLMGTHSESSKTKVLEEIELGFVEIDEENTVMVFGIPEEDMGDNFYNFYDPFSVKDSIDKIKKGKNIYENIHLKVIAKINDNIAFEGVIV